MFLFPSSGGAPVSEIQPIYRQLHPLATAARFEAAYAFIFSSSSTSSLHLQQLLFIFFFPSSGGDPGSDIQPIYRQLYPLATVVRFEAAYAFIVSSSSTNSLHLHLLFSQLWGSPGIGNPGDLPATLPLSHCRPI